MLDEDLLCVRVSEACAIAHALGDFADCPPICARLTRRRQKRALARHTAFAVGHRAILLAPRQRGQTNVRVAAGVCIANDFRHDNQFATFKRCAYVIGVGHADQRIGAHDPHRTHGAVVNGVEQLYRLQAGLVCDRRALPEILHERAVLWLAEFQVRR